MDLYTQLKPVTLDIHPLLEGIKVEADFKVGRVVPADRSVFL